MASSTTGYVIRECMIFVKNFPSTFNEYDFFFIFKKFGEIDNIRMGANGQNFCIVTMVSISAADNVRAHLSGGVLHTKKHSLTCSDWRTDENKKPAKPAAPKSLKKPELKVYTKILRIGNKVSVKAVEHLPLNPANAAFEPTFAVRIADDEDHEDYIRRMSETIGEHCKNKNPFKNLAVPNDYLFKHEDLYYRARLVSPFTMYLLDVGITVPLVAKHVFEMKSIFTSFPAATAICELEGVNWKIEKFDKFRAVFKQCSDTLGNLKLETTDFNGGVNYVKVFVENDNLAVSLQEKGLCTYKTTTGPRKYVYDRETMYGLRHLGCKDKVDAKGLLILENLKNLRIHV